MSGQKNKHFSLLAILRGFFALLGVGLFVANFFQLLPKDLIDQELLNWLILGILAILTILSFIPSKKSHGSGGFQRPVANTPCNDEMSAIINSIGEGIVVLDDKKNIALINPKAKKLSSWNEDAIGLNFQSVLRLSDKEGVEVSESKNPILTAISSSQSLENHELCLKNSKGDLTPISLKIDQISGTGRWVLVFYDNSSDVKRNQQQLEFISTASHEMRTPVTAIDGYLSLILNPKICQIDAKAQEYASKAQESSKHLGVLFKNLLDVSKIDDDRVSAKTEAIELVDFTRNVCQSLKTIADQKKIKLIFLPDQKFRDNKKVQPILHIEADKNLLTEALSNLIENAIKYTPEGQVTVNVAPGPQNEALVSIQDTGIGIAEEDIPHLFQKFYRIDNRDTREIGGTGLGLYLTKRIVETLKGRIWVESKVKQGSTFWMAFRRLSEQETRVLMSTTRVNPNETKIGDERESSSPAPQKPQVATPVVSQTTSANPAVSTAPTTPTPSPTPTPQPASTPKQTSPITPVVGQGPALQSSTQSPTLQQNPPISTPQVAQSPQTAPAVQAPQAPTTPSSQPQVVSVAPVTQTINTQTAPSPAPTQAPAPQAILSTPQPSQSNTEAPVNRVIPQSSAEKLQALGYNTTAFTTVPDPNQQK